MHQNYNSIRWDLKEKTILTCLPFDLLLCSRTREEAGFTLAGTMPKAKGKNAFFFFMLDWKKRAEAQGREFPNGLKDVQQDPDCNEEWQVTVYK